MKKLTLKKVVLTNMNPVASVDDSDSMTADCIPPYQPTVAGCTYFC